MAAPDYVLGYSEHEQKRLLKQAAPPARMD